MEEEQNKTPPSTSSSTPVPGQEEPAKKKYPCKLCDMSYATKSALSRHKAISHDMIRFECNVCYKLFTTKPVLKKHFRIHLGNTFQFMCDSCPKVFTERRALEKHQKSHALGKDDLKCEYCDRIFPNLRGLSRHRTQQHSGKKKKYSCKSCPKSFSNKGKLYEHKLFVHEKKDYICPYCGKSFEKHRRNLCTHIATVHAKTRSYLCELCGNSFKTERAVNRHVIQVHNRDRSQDTTCVFCGKGFYSKSEETYHTLTHIKERPIICEGGCTREFTTRQDMKRHLPNCKRVPYRPASAKPPPSSYCYNNNHTLAKAHVPPQDHQQQQQNAYFAPAPPIMMPPPPPPPQVQPIQPSSSLSLDEIFYHYLT